MLLSEESLRLDYLLLRRLTPDGEPVDNSAQTLRHLWPLLPRVSVVEYKSPGYPYRSGQLDRLWGYVHIYFANQRALPRHRADGMPLTPAEGGPDVREREDLCAVLIVPARLPSLDADVKAMGLRWEDLGGGYLKVHGGLFTLYVVEINIVGPAEGDDLLLSFGRGPGRSLEARRFWWELLASEGAAMDIQDMEGYEELMAKLLDGLPAEQRLAGLPAEQVLSHYAPEQRLAGLPPEQVLSLYAPEERLADLDRDHQALALPIEILQLLPEAYLRSLSPEAESEIRRRLRQNAR
ncbi:MAG TPA: hypothetical protein VHT91_06405 [Kofleriaceae bacterium]|nr:hypothetical protein [Kofleriaceae bacterium]